MEWLLKVHCVEDGLGSSFGKQPFISDSDGITYRFVTMKTFAVHRVTDRNAQVDIVVYGKVGAYCPLSAGKN